MERYNMETKFDKHSVPVAIDNIPKKERKTNKQQRQKKMHTQNQQPQLYAFSA